LESLAALDRNRWTASIGMPVRHRRNPQARWKYLYRAIDRDGALVDVMLSKHSDLSAAKAFFRSAKAVTGVTPDRVTTAADPG
jgi:hypothetical protein